MGLLSEFFQSINEHHVWDFKHGDKVRIIAGKFGGSIGVVSDTWTGDNEDSVLVSFADGEDSPGNITMNFTPDSIELYLDKED